jgi:hypothetical protein
VAFFGAGCCRPAGWLLNCGCAHAGPASWSWSVVGLVQRPTSDVQRPTSNAQRPTSNVQRPTTTTNDSTTTTTTASRPRALRLRLHHAARRSAARRELIRRATCDVRAGYKGPLCSSLQLEATGNALGLWVFVARNVRGAARPAEQHTARATRSESGGPLIARAGRQ